MIPFFLLILWFFLILAGGFLLVRSCFNLRPEEEWITGLAVAICVEVVFTALLSNVIRAPASFYLAAGLVFLAGLGLFILNRPSTRVFSWQGTAPILGFIPIFLLAFAICRGMAIFDDYAHLPTTSLMAAGQIPPPFAYAPGVTYAYHYFMMLFAAQVMRIGNVLPWTALDLARAFSLGLAVFLAGFWTIRVTKSKVAGVLAGIFIAFGSGTRWLIFLFPVKFLEELSKQVTLIGSGASSGATLLEAIMSNWRIEGASKLPIPFAFTNGIVQPGVLAMHGANGLFEIMVILLLLLTWNTWRGKKAAILTVIILSSLSLIGELDIILLIIGWVVLTAIFIIKKRTMKLDQDLALWGWILAGSFILSLLEGGAFLNIISSWFSSQVKSYPEVGLVLNWPPSIISPHLGSLSIFNWRTLLLAIIEVGPVILVAPVLLIYGLQCWKLSKWFEAILILGFFLTLGSIIVNYQGSTGIRNTIHLYLFLMLFTIYFIPTLWNWAVDQRGMGSVWNGFTNHDLYYWRIGTIRSTTSIAANVS